MKTVPTWSECRGRVSCYVGVASGHYVYIKCPPLPTTHSVVIFNTTDGPPVLPLVQQLIMTLIEVLLIYGFINLINYDFATFQSFLLNNVQLAIDSV